MSRRLKVNEIHLQINDLIPFRNERCVGFMIQWCSDIGFGEYTVFKPNGSNEWQADSEHMDSNEDKDFIKELMKLFVEKLNIEE